MADRTDRRGFLKRLAGVAAGVGSLAASAEALCSEPDTQTREETEADICGFFYGWHEGDFGEVILEGPVAMRRTV